MSRFKAPVLRLLFHIAALLPLALLAWNFSQDRLTANPIEEITIRTGQYSLIILVLSLACTPINKVLGINWVLPLRRPLGLYAFIYATLHILNFIGLDYAFDFALLNEDALMKGYTWVGFGAFLGMLLLALSSVRGLMPSWLSKYRPWLTYLSILLVIIHFMMLAKGELGEPLLYTAIVALLLLIRQLGAGKELNVFRRQSAGS